MKVVLYMAMSVNGMIADDDDNAPWSDAIWESYVASVKEYGNIIVGSRTYEIMKKSGDLDSFTVKPLWVVVSGRPLEDSDAVFVSSLPEAIEKVREEGFNAALIGGGSKLVTSALQAGLIDEIELDIEPVLMTQGIPLLQSVPLNTKLELQEIKKLDDQVIHVSYSVIKEDL